MGFWIRTNVAADKLAFPAIIERLEFFGPHPEPGCGVGCTVWIRSMTDTAVKADLELRSADGTVWSRITGWEDRRFTTDDAVDPILRWPETNRIAEQQPGGWFLLADRWPDPANRELIMRRYLTAAEREQYQAQSPRSRHRWLLGRMVVKDAVRQSQWDRGAGPLFPAEFAVINDAAGRPSVRGRLDGPVDISIAHTGELAVAIVGPPEGAGDGIGIDVEVVEERSQQFETMAFSDAERALLDRCAAATAAAAGAGAGRSQAQARLEWVTRFWCAKEALAKAEGTGLGGLPQRFVIERLAGEAILVSLRDDPHNDGGRPRWVETRSLDHLPTTKSYVAAWTLPVTAAVVPHPLDKETTHGR
jgi:phosphopantetheinyl transferase